MRQPFQHMDEASKRFYVKVVNNAILNIHAVRRGFFDVLLCETTDPSVTERWDRAVPQIIEMIMLDNKAK